MSTADPRRREPPRERFLGTERCINLMKAFDELPRESEARQGHMQKALYRLGPTTTAIFAFEAGGRLDQHRVDGEAMIHVIAGRLRVRTSGGEHELGPHDLLLLDPGVQHDVEALEPTRMVLNVVLREG